MHNDLKGKKILVTSGPTCVAIDEMRVIANRSTGEMGRLIANACAKKGANVTLLEGAATTNMVLDKGVLVRKFFFFDELDNIFKSALQKKPNIVIHAAAVSDFRPKKIFKGKADSRDQLTLALVPTRKLISDVKKFAPQSFLVGFKFEPSLKTAIYGAKALLKESGCDLVVANSLNSKGYCACLVRRDGSVKRIVRNRREIVRNLTEEIVQ